MKHVICLVLAIYASFHLFAFNDYMHKHQVNAEVVDKEVRKGSKRKIIHEIAYKQDDGNTFKLRVSEPEWQAALPGEKARLYLRPYDVKQTTVENMRYFMLPILVSSVTLVYLLWFLFFGWTAAPKEKKFVQPSTKGPFEERSDDTDCALKS